MPQGRRTTLLTCALAVCAAVAGACAGEPGLPTGDALTVIRDAPAATRSAGEFLAFVQSPGRSRQGDVDLASQTGPVDIRSRVEAVLDLLEDAEEAVAFGGQQIRGASTLRYEVTTAEGADIDVWIDSENRARRIEVPNVPLPPPDRPAPTQPENGLPDLLTVDLVFE
jgi:hypothetical protein